MRFLKLVWIISFIVLAFCNAHAKDLKQVSVQFQWKNTFEFAGFFMAKEKGFYKNVGLNVQTKEWEYGIDVVKNVENNQSTFGVTRTSSLIDIVNGSDIVYLLAVYQSCPTVLLTDKSSGIKSIKDFKNKRIMLTDDHLKDASIVSMLVSQGVRKTDFIKVRHSFDVRDLLDKETDVMASYISNEPFLLKEAGGEPVIFKSKDYGFDFYNDIVIVSRKYLEKYPKEVRNFKNATLLGYKYAFEHIDEAVELIYKKYNTLGKSKKALLYEAKELKKIFYQKNEKVGSLSEEKIQKTYNIYKLLGLAKNKLDTSKIIYKDIEISTDLTEDEKRYLQKKQSIKLCADPDWLPFDKIYDNGKYIGMNADYVKLFEKILSVKIDLVKTSTWSETLQKAKSRKCDIITSASKTPERQKFLNFTTPYIKYPLVAATRTDVPFVNGIEDLLGKKVGAMQDYAYVELFKDKYPSIKFVLFNDKNVALDKVNQGEIFAFVDVLPSIAYALQANQSQNLKISGKIFDDNWKLGLGVRNDDRMMLKVFEKAIKQVTQEQKQEILNKWISIKYENGLNYELIKKILFIGLGILFLIILWSIKIHSKNKLLKQAQEEIETKNEELRQLATIDKLTGICNRLRLDALLAQEIKRSKRYGSKFGIALVDIDHFKIINDTFGHQTGDIVLREIGKVLKEKIRATDYVGRWGGEEFLILCLEIKEDSLFNVIEKIRKAIEEHEFPQVNNITASFGVTTYRLDDSIEMITKRADKALYEAKEGGRNKVVKI